jgi:hypothetical protein
MKTEKEIRSKFQNISSIDEAKKIYRKLAKELHPDMGGDDESFKILNNIYNEIIEHKIFFSNDSKIDLELEKIISQILHYENIEIEIIGEWIWISGETKLIKEHLKRLNFKWARAKKMWYFGELKKRSSRGKKSIEEIRSTYGSQKVQTKKRGLLVA